MMPAESHPSREDVLYAFTQEPNPGRDSLEQYLQDYPQYAAELLDMSSELTCDVVELSEDDAPLSEDELTLIDLAWLRHVAAAPLEVMYPFANLSVTEQRQLAQFLDVPRQVITAFREHRIKSNSVPVPFLERLAAALNSKIEILQYSLRLPPEPNLARSYKTDGKPKAHVKVNFEQILIDANVPLDKQKKDEL
jgi:hypothetical protein